jgi:L-fuconolactonase
MRIDAHQHYWDTGAFDYGWAQAGLPALERPFLPGDLEPQLAAVGIDRTVVVQVLHTTEETAWLLDLARANPSIAGVVGWVDLEARADDIEGSLAGLRDDPRLVGIRHLVHEEPDVGWLTRPAVIRGLGVLERTGVPFDLLLRPAHLRHVPLLSERLPGLRMVVDHIAKPLIAARRMEPWATDVRAAAANPNVWCKLSGMITEADHAAWSPDDLAPYVEVALDAFGVGRLMYGSDWPVCTLAGSYGQVIGALRTVLGSIDAGVEARLFGGSAAEFYGIEIEEEGSS